MKVTLESLTEELRFADTALQPYLETYQRGIESFTGKSYRRGKGRNAPENHALEWFSLMRGQLLMGNPRCRFTTDVPGDPQARALALTHACNTLSQMLQLRKVNEQLLMDFGFKWAVALIASEPQPGYTGATDVPKWPAVYRISPLHFRYDVAAQRPETRAWSAHLLILRKDELGEEWDKSVIEKNEMDVKKFRDPTNKVPDRGEVAIWEVWVRGDESRASEGYHGKLYWVIDNQASKDQKWVREPEPYFGPPWGPYVVGGDYVVPDDSAPMGTLTASDQQAEFLNAIKRATNRAITKYKRVILTTGTKLPEIIKNGPNDFVFHVDEKDLKNAVVEQEIAGATEQHFIAAQDAHNTLDRVSGITDLMRGVVDPRNKATADALAAQASGNRTSGTVSKFRDLNQRMFWSMAYFVSRDDEFKMTLPEDLQGAFLDAQGNPATEIQGGLHPDESPDEFFKLNLELKVGSMERDLEADTQYQMMVINNAIQRIAAFGPQTALFVDWDTIHEEEAELTGVEALKKIVDTKTMRMISAAMLKQQVAGEPKPDQGTHVGYNPPSDGKNQPVKTTVAGASRVKSIASTADQAAA